MKAIFASSVVSAIICLNSSFGLAAHANNGAPSVGPTVDIGAPNPAVLGLWHFYVVASDMGVDVTERIEADSIEITAVCTYPAYLPMYTTTTRLRVAARVGQDSIWSETGSATSSSGPLKCPFNANGSGGHVASFVLNGDTITFLDQNGKVPYTSNGVPVIFQRAQK